MSSTVTARLEAIVNRAMSLQRRVSRIEEDLDALTVDLAWLARELRSDHTSSQTVISSPGPGDSDTVLQRLAEHGARSLEIQRRSSGEADVRVDEGDWITLPATLTELLVILTRSSGDNGDGLGSWKSKDEIAIILSKHLGRHFSRNTIHQLVSRLRKALRRAGVNPFLLQTARDRGARFAVRSKKNDVSSCDRT